MKDEKLTVPLELSAEDIRLIADESENTESPELGDFLGGILKKADETVQKMGDTIKKMNEANPFAKQHKEAKK
ncbi:MAG: hypothetical protein IJR39_04380 [Treponema sp.]|nr:hypothetical protein [Treponema sp.]